jgi:hypothetical protein
MRFTTYLYCDILGYDAVQFDMYRVSIKSFPDYKHYKKTTWNINFFFSKCNSTQEVFLQLTKVNVKKYDVFLTVHHSINLL